MKKYSLALVLLLMGLGHAESLNEFAKNMEKRSGFFDVYYDSKQAKVYIKVEQFEQDFILMQSLPYGLGSNDIGLDRGLQNGSKLVFFSRVGNKVFLTQKNTAYRASSNNTMERQSVREAFADSILAAFTISAESKTSVLIDVTDFLLADHIGVGKRLKQLKQGNFSLNKSLSSVDPSVIKSFPKNTELQSIITFSGNGAGSYLKQVTPDNSQFTLRQRVSLVALPEKGYQPRVFHPFSGFWAESHVDYAAGLLESKEKRFIPRHRLFKKDPSAPMSEPVTPIVYYVDNGAPEPVRSALLEGARWWDQAFEAAGYKNAFQVKVLPQNVDPMDVRYNVIQWVHRATRGWSYGAGITDPRTGEIIKGHVTLGSLRVRQDLLIAQGVTAPFKNENAQSRQLKMALDRIRQLSAHEVGHTLGIAHNFSASVNQRASVMDYPHPLITMDEKGEISLQNAYAKGIGEWDKQVIKYGYGDFRAHNEVQMLADIIAESKQKNLQFISDPDARPQDGEHATAHLWDNGANPSEELARMIKVRALALNNFSQDVVDDGVPYSQIEEVLVPVYNLHRFQVEAASKLLGGSLYQYAVKGEDEFIQQKVNKEQQKKTLEVLMQTLSSDFLYLDDRIQKLIPPKAYGYYKTRESFKSRTGLSFDALSVAEASAAHTLSLMLNPQRITRMASDSTNFHASKMLDVLTQQLIKTQTRQAQHVALNMRTAHVYIGQLLRLAQNKDLPIEGAAVVSSQLAQISDWLKREKGRIRKSNLRYGYYHVMLNDIAAKHVRNNDAIPLLVLPPGSPIGG